MSATGNPADIPHIEGVNIMPFQTRNGYEAQVRKAAGHWNGYVELPLGHPCYGMDYDEIHDTYDNVRVHGGLTYAWRHANDKWVIGFDTFHYWDGEEGQPNYRTQEYVMEECENLATQMEQIAQQ